MEEGIAQSARVVERFSYTGAVIYGSVALIAAMLRIFVEFPESSVVPEILMVTFWTCLGFMSALILVAVIMTIALAVRDKVKK